MVADKAAKVQGNERSRTNISKSLSHNLKQVFKKRT
jgi:hypothetical protein